MPYTFSKHILSENILTTPKKELSFHKKLKQMFSPITHECKRSPAIHCKNKTLCTSSRHSVPPNCTHACKRSPAFHCNNKTLCTSSRHSAPPNCIHACKRSPAIHCKNNTLCTSSRHSAPPNCTHAQMLLMIIKTL